MASSEVDEVNRPLSQQHHNINVIQCVLNYSQDLHMKATTNGDVDLVQFNEVNHTVNFLLCWWVRPVNI